MSASTGECAHVEEPLARAVVEEHHVGLLADDHVRSLGQVARGHEEVLPSVEIEVGERRFPT